MPGPLLAAVPGLIQAGASLFGGKARRREQQRAQAQFDADNAAVRNFQFTNPNRNLENTAEDMTVNQQATNVQRAAQDASLSQGLDAIVASGGGGGGATAIANAALQANQGISADLAGQEQRIQQATASQAAANQMAEAQGEAALQSQQHGQLTANLGQSGQRLAAANAARQQATQALVSGLGSAAGGAIGAIGGGGGGAAAGATPAPSDFSQFTAPGGGLGFNPSSPFSRSPLKQNGDKLTPEQIAQMQKELDAKGKSIAGFTQLSRIYGRGDDAAHGSTSQNYQDQLAKYKQKHGADASEKKFQELYHGKYDEEGLLNPYAQSRADVYGKAAEQSAADQQAFRDEMAHNWEIIGAGGQRNRLQALTKALGSDEFRGLSTGPIKEQLKRAQQGNLREGDLEKITQLLESRGRGSSSHGKQVGKLLQDLYKHDKYAEQAWQKKQGESPINRGEKKKARPSSWESHFKRTKKLHDSLKKKSAPTKRTPFYRTKWMGTSKY